MTELPEKFKQRMQEQLGESYNAFLLSYDEKPKKSLHLNLLKCSKDDVDGIIPMFDWGENGYYAPENAGKHPYHAAGLYYIQEPSAMLAAMSFDMPPSARVLDMCAAPGGKTSQLAQRAGLLVSNEIEHSRYNVLKENVTRIGYNNVVTTNAFPQRLAQMMGGFFDVVLVDAPCSGEGMFRKNPQAARDWSVRHVEACAARQKEIVLSAAECLKTGGIMVYSTCTFAKEEDEEVVQFLTENGFQLQPINPRVAALGVDTGLGSKFYPHIFGEGQFIAVLKRTAHSAPPAALYKHKWASKKHIMQLGEIMDTTGLNIAQYGDYLYAALDVPAYAGGARIAKIENSGRLSPLHALFTTFGDRCLRSTELSEGQANDYLRGHELEGEGNGWGVARLNGFALGGYKASAGRLKNHYPKNLRNGY